MMEFDWNLCVICQEKTTESLKCPLNTHDPRCDKADAYSSFLSNVAQFQAIGALPVKLQFACNVEDFVTNSASWHKSCHLKFNNSKLAKAKKRHSTTEDTETTKRTCKREPLSVQKCIFCEAGDEEGYLHQYSAFNSDNNLRPIVTELQDTKLQARIAGGDLMAIEAKYHLQCLTNLRNRYRSHIRKNNKMSVNTDGKRDECRVFLELINYIEKSVESGIAIFKLSELHSLYVHRLEDMGINKGVNKTRLKDKLLQHFPESQEQQNGKYTIIVFKEGMRSMLSEALKVRDFSEDTAILAKAAMIIR